MTASKQILVFDIGGVLYENTGFEVLRELMGDKSEQEARDIWLNSQAVDLFETGKIGPQEFAASVVDELGFALLPQQFLHEFATWPKGFYPGAPELIAELREHYTVGCLSNSNVLHWRDEFDALFDFALASHRIGVAKPKPAAFDYLKTTLTNKHLTQVQAKNQTPAQTLAEVYFFDDSQSNIEAGQQAGLRARLTFGFEQVLEVLAAEGIRHD